MSFELNHYFFSFFFSLFLSGLVTQTKVTRLHHPLPSEQGLAATSNQLTSSPQVCLYRFWDGSRLGVEAYVRFWDGSKIGTSPIRMNPRTSLASKPISFNKPVGTLNMIPNIEYNIIGIHYPNLFIDVYYLNKL